MARLFSWWRPFQLGTSSIVVLPDAINIFLAAMGGIYLVMYSLGWQSVLAYSLALLVSPFILLQCLWIRDSKVTVIRLFVVVPYWVTWVPDKARFDLFQAWEDPAPTGVAFDLGASDPVHLGTATSAESLYEHISAVLANAGWKNTTLGWERPSAPSTHLTP